MIAARDLPHPQLASFGWRDPIGSEDNPQFRGVWTRPIRIQRFLGHIDEYATNLCVWEGSVSGGLPTGEGTCRPAVQ